MTDSPRDISGFPPGWERELKRVSDAVFGGWDENGRREGVIERLEHIEILIRWGVAVAGCVGAGIGSLATLAVQHLMGIK